MENDVLKKQSFSKIDINDPFFDSLKSDYSGFHKWFEKKSIDDEYAYTVYGESSLIGFLYLKSEMGVDQTIFPDISNYVKRLKVGTFKIDAHGTVLGNRFMSLILQEFVSKSYDACYVTMFDKQHDLMGLFKKFGFFNFGQKGNSNEIVLLKDNRVKDNIFQDYPKFNLSGNKYLISIRPEFHTTLFPDSRLMTEKDLFTEDVSATNSTTKVFLSSLRDLRDLRLEPGDKLVIYRTAEKGRSAEYSSVATSICTVVDYRNIDEFKDYNDFKKFVTKYSIFSEQEISQFWQSKRYPFVLKFVYNTAFPHRITRHDLIEKNGIDRSAYPGFMRLTDEIFQSILEEAKLNESFIIN